MTIVGISVFIYLSSIRNKKIPSSNCLIIKVKPMISCPLLQPARLADSNLINYSQVLRTWHPDVTLHCQILRTLLLLDLNIENSLLQHNQVKLKISTFCHLLLAIGQERKLNTDIFSSFVPLLFDWDRTHQVSVCPTSAKKLENYLLLC